MSSETRRLAILTDKEIDDLYALPKFTDEERHLYFTLSAVEREAVDAVHTISVSIHLILQLGYFKAKRQFFVYEPESVLEDLQYIFDQHFPDSKFSALKTPSKPIRLEQWRTILKIFNFRLCDSHAKDELELKSQRLAMLSTQPIYILREARQSLTHQRIVAPGYRFMQEMIGRVVAAERKRITQLLERALTPSHIKHLDALLQADEGMYRISTFKHEANDFSYKELRREVERRKFFQALHAEWKNCKKGKFMIERDLKRHTIFIDFSKKPKAYAVLGLNSEIYEMIGDQPLPIMVETVLLPWFGKIIHDGIFVAQQVVFGPNCVFR